MSDTLTAAPSEPEWAAFAAIDWADRKNFWRLMPAGSRQSEAGEVENTPEAVEAWAAALQQRFGGRPVAVILEQSRGALVKTPLRYLVSALRAVGADTHAHAPLLEYLTRMGQGVFQFPTPDGYPQSAEAQAGTLLWRWTLAVAIGTQALPTVSSPLQALDAALLAGGSGPTVLSRWGALLFGQALDPELLARLDAADRRLGGVLLGERVALLLCAPHFMRC